MATSPLIRYIEIPRGAVPHHRTLESIKDAVCLDLGLPTTIAVRYYRHAANLYEQGLAALGQLGLELDGPAEITGGFTYTKEILGIASRRRATEVWLSAEGDGDTRQLAHTLAHELYHQRQYATLREDPEALAASRRELRRDPRAVRARLEQEADDYADRTIKRLDRQELAL